MNLIFHEIHPDSINKIKKWGNKLTSDYINEALQTLEQEGVTQEIVFISKLQDKVYLVGITERSGTKGGTIIDKSNTLNKEHRKILDEAIVDRAVSKGELIYHLKRKA